MHTQQLNEDARSGTPPTLEISRFRAVVLAALRVKQLRRGSKPRIDPEKHKNTSIAVEEVRRGLISFASHPVTLTHPYDPSAMEGENRPSDNAIS